MLQDWFIGFVFFFAVLIVFRFVSLWYFRIDERLEAQKEILQELKVIREKLAPENEKKSKVAQELEQLLNE